MKAIEYHPDGRVKRVEFKTGADYPQIVPFDPGRFVIGTPLPVPPYTVTC